MEENNFIKSYVSNVWTVIYKKCRGAQFIHTSLFFKVRFLETFYLVDQITGIQLFLHILYVVRQIKYLHLYESFGTQNKELNLEINLHSLKVMETSLFFFLLIIWRPTAKSFKIALAKSVLKQSPKKRHQ